MIKRVVLLGIRMYQNRWPSRWKRHCLFEPSCSRYAMLAIAKFGLRRGTVVALHRVARCKPPVLEWQDYP